LRLQCSLKRTVEKLNRVTSIDQSVATTVAEKIAALEPRDFLDDRKNKADMRI